MGEYGSGRSYPWDKKDTVEDCRALDVNKLTRDKLLKAGQWVSGSLTRANTRTGEQVSSLGFEADTRESAASLIGKGMTMTNDSRHRRHPRPADAAGQLGAVSVEEGTGH